MQLALANVGIPLVACKAIRSCWQASDVRILFILPFCSGIRRVASARRACRNTRATGYSAARYFRRSLPPESRGGGVGEIIEGELRAKLRAGERVTGVIVVARSVDDALEYTPFLLLSWRRGYYRIVRWRGGDRRYREFDRLLKLLRDLGWADSVAVFDAADPKLRRIRAIAHALGVPPTPRGKGDAAAVGDTDDDVSGVVPTGEDADEALGPPEQA